MSELAPDLLERARAQAGDVDRDGDVVDLHLMERLRQAICPESTVDVDRHLQVVVSLVRGRGS